MTGYIYIIVHIKSSHHNYEVIMSMNRLQLASIDIWIV